MLLPFSLLFRLGSETILSASVSDTLTEMRSFSSKVDSPDGVRQDIGRFA